MRSVTCFFEAQSRSRRQARRFTLRNAIRSLSLALVFAIGDQVHAEVPGFPVALAAGDCKAAGDAVNVGLARNDPEAFFFAGLLYDQSDCVEHDAARAARLYRRAIALGYDGARVALGLLYALGRGVPPDYAMAHRAFHGDKPAPGDDAASPAQLAALGYGETIAKLALRRVSYPASANSDGIEGSVDVIITPVSDQAVLVNVHFGVEVGSKIARSHDFTDQIEAAYREAIAQAPRPESASDASIRIDTPWQFAMRRASDNRKVRLEGYIALGDSRIVQ